MTLTRRGLLAVPGFAIAAQGLRPIEAFAAKALPYPVTYDLFSLKLYGKRLYHWSGEFHYWRLPSPGLWRDVLQKYRAAGFTAASVYFHWGFHSSAPGKYDFTGIRDVALLLEIAAEVGIYIAARPGPYINAETDFGGFPGWLLPQAGGVRTSAQPYLESALEWLSEINAILSKYQIDRGGPIILYQIENEFSSSSPDAVAYMQALETRARADGITVPFFDNNIGAYGLWRPGSPGGVNIYGIDSYTQGFNATHPEVWRPVYDFYYLRTQGAELNPEFIAETQGGSYDYWAGPGFANCYELTNPNFNRVFYKNNIAGGVTMQSFYMLFGGTSWGWLPSEDLYTSYDYGAAITEGRQLTGKYDEDKKIGYFVSSVRPITYTNTVPDVASSNPKLRVRSLVNPTTLTQFFTLIQADSTSTSFQQVTFPISLNMAAYQTVPQQGVLVINGRDCKLLVAGYAMDRQSLMYSTSEIMTHARIGARDVAVFYGRVTEDGETVLHYASTPMVDVLAGTVSSVYDSSSGDLRLNYVHSGLTLLRITGGKAPLVLGIADDAAAATFWRFDVGGQPVLIRGPTLVRTASFNGNTIALTGDTAVAGPIEVFTSAASAGAPLTWNGARISSTPTRYGSILGSLPGPMRYVPPAIDGWRTITDVPETAAGFDDSNWVAAANSTTSNPMQPPVGQVVLYADDYGYHHGDTWYRARFTATGSESGITLTAYTGRAGSFFVWLNGTLLGQTEVGLTNPNATSTFSFPSGALKPGAPNVVSVLVENLGHVEGVKQPRGLTAYELVGSSAAVGWKVQGVLGGENPVDTVRGPYNNGGLHGERAGYHLPGFPDGSWSEVALPASQPTAGVTWYRTTVSLATPTGQDVSLALQITDNNTRDYRARIFVNGWHMGIYINKVGPQTRFVVPNGILNTAGENTIAVAVLDGADGSGGLGAISFVVLGNVRGGVTVPLVESPSYNSALYTG